ncbi:MAG: glycosyltransferase family 4 protein [Candidatus Hydrogenedentes bacterium]|nr:glycosyltransferase family 4 protein [Candidatus Hydrogenedentota bacterium]
MSTVRVDTQEPAPDMRIGFDMGPITKCRTGVGNYCLSLLRHMLLRVTSDVSVCGLSASLRPPALDEFPPGLCCRWLPLPTRLMYLIWNGLHTPAADTLLGGVDVYHATNYFLPPVKRAKTVLTIYDLAFVKAPELCSPKVVGPFSRGVARFVRKADLVIAASESTKRDLVNLLGAPEDKVRVVYGAAGEGVRAVPRDEAVSVLARRYGVEGPFFLFVGTLEPRKNVAGAIRAFRRVARDLPHRLVLLGGLGWNTGEIERELANPATEGRILRPGMVPDEDLGLFYSAAEALVFPSFHEGFGLPALEAMACGCPVITSNTSSLPEVCGGAALYCPPADEEGLANAMRRVASDRALRLRMIGDGHVQAGRFSWSGCAQQTLDIYREVTLS